MELEVEVCPYQLSLGNFVTFVANAATNSGFGDDVLITRDDGSTWLNAFSYFPLFNGVFNSSFTVINTFS